MIQKLLLLFQGINVSGNNMVWDQIKFSKKEKRLGSRLTNE
ncbi:hypothetical protein [Paenibacillus sp. TC-CSREp1]